MEDVLKDLHKGLSLGNDLFKILFCCLYFSNLSKKSTKISLLILKQSRSRSVEGFHEIYLHICTKKKSYDQPRQHVKKQRYYFANKGPPSQSYGFSGSHVRM